MESPKRPRNAVLATTGLLLAICLLGAGILAPIQNKALQANRAHTLTAFSAFPFDLAQRLVGEADLIATLARPGNDTAGMASSLAVAFARTDFAHQKLKKALGRFNSAPYGAELQRDLVDAAEKFGTIDRMRNVRAVDVKDAAAILRSYNAAIGQLIEAILHVERLGFSDAGPQRLHSDFAIRARLARVLSLEFDFGAAHYADAGSGAIPAANWADIVARRRVLVNALPGDLKDGQPIGAGGAVGDLLFSSASTTETAAAPAFSTWATGMLRAAGSALTQANTLLSDMRTRTDRVATNADNTFVTVAIIVLALALCIVTWRNDMTAQQGLFALSAMVNVALIGWHLGSESANFSSEGGPLEVCQALALLVAAGLFARAWIKGEHAVRNAALIMMCVCIMMFFRELEFRALGLPENVLRLSGFPGRRLLYYAGAAAIGVYAFTKWRQLLSLNPQRFMVERWPLYLWPVLLLVGELVEHVAHETRKDDLHGHWAAGRFWEEFLELNAYVLLAFSAFVFASLLAKQAVARKN